MWCQLFNGLPWTARRLRRRPVVRDLKIPGSSADKHRPLAHVRSSLTDSADVLATGTMLVAA
jgi:hypothetical protein